jgi:general secretion pathway protein C
MMKKYYAIANLLLLTAISYMLVSTVYSVSLSSIDFSEEAPSVIKGKIPVQGKQKTKTLESYSEVLKKDYFRTAKTVKAEPVVKDLDVDKLEQTSLNLRLWGTISGSESLSYAIIEDTKQKEQLLYKVGDSINNAVLKAVLPDKVVLSVNGKDEVLEIEKEGKGIKGARTPSRRMTMDTANQEAPASSTSIALSRSQINESLQDINKLMKEIRIRPHFKNGESDGLIVSGIKSDSIFKKMGLRNGDIIMGVDGNKIESVEDAMKLHSGLNEASNVQLQIKRRGRLENIDFEIN